MSAVEAQGERVSAVFESSVTQDDVLADGAVSRGEYLSGFRLEPSRAGWMTGATTRSSWR
jgi:hypothetical protein